jgi:hypothetical protein
MYKRTVVAIEPGFEDAWQMRLFKAPVEIENARKPEIFNCDPDGMLVWDSDAAVRQHGQKLLDELRKHPAIKEAIKDLMKVAPGHSHSFYVYLMVEAAERLCWETLCGNTGEFLSLDTRWPIARIADSVVDRQLPMYSFKPPLKVMALLSALNRPAAMEWEGLKKAVLASRAANFDIELFVLVGEQTLFDTINQEIANGLQGVQVEPVPDRTSELENLIGDEFRPQILHFFCHGSTSLGLPRLELATILDWRQENPGGSLKVEVNELLGLLAMQEIWLVTLNCCEGGKAEENMHSMAHRLVAHGVPAAVGVLEPFDAADAHEFSAGFYPAIFTKLQRLIEQAADDGVIEMEWADALRPPRKNLCQKHGDDPSNHREWALPVMYVRPEPFRLRVVPPDLNQEVLQNMKLKAQEIAGILSTMPPTSPVTYRQALLDLLADLPDAIKPDLYGNFQDG